MADEQPAPANVPRPPPPAAGPPGVRPPGSGKPLKMVIPIVILVAVVFGVTFVSQYTPKKGEDDTGAAVNSGGTGEHPLRFISSIRKWYPTGEPENKYFAGFFEPGEAVHSTSFWVENRNPSTVSIEVTTKGCTGCRLAAIPAPMADQLVLTSILSGFPQGPVSGLPLAFAATGANLAPSRLSWQQGAVDDNTTQEVKFPAASGSGHLWPYQWGVIELSFKVSGVGPPRQIPAAELVQRLDEGGATGADVVQVEFEGMDAFDILPRYFDVGELMDGTEPKKVAFVVYSCTRGPNLFGLGGNEPLVVPRIGSNLGPFATVSDPERLNTAELEIFSAQMFNAAKKLIRVDTAYRFEATIKARAGDRLADIGDLVVDVPVEAPGVAGKKTIRIKGTVRGPMWLDNNRKEIQLTSYEARRGIIQTVRVICEQADAEVRLVPAECEPPFVQYQVKKLPGASDRGYLELKVTVPENAKAGPWSGKVVLELVGPRPQRMRIPIRGVATER